MKINSIIDLVKDLDTSRQTKNLNKLLIRILLHLQVEFSVLKQDGTKKNVRKPVINSLLFFHSETYIAKEIQKILTDKVILYTRQIDFKKIPLAIPEREMNIFMLVTSSGEKGLEYFDTDNPKFYQGDHVKVIDGTFKGAEGYICRIKKNHRLIITVHGVCAVATSYIPQAFLKKIP